MKFFPVVLALVAGLTSVVAHHHHKGLHSRHLNLKLNLQIEQQNSTLTPSNPETFWIGDITHNGTSPFLNDTSYTVYRNVKDFGAVGDGSTDDSDAIQRAIDDGDRCASGCGGTTLKPALVYFPAGTYKVSKTINMYLFTQLVGDAINWPTIKATNDIGANYVIDGFPIVDGVHSTTNFHVQVRNLKIDVTSVNSTTEVKCINWAVAQATSLHNMEFIMSNYSSHYGIVQNGENGGGSGVFMGDLTFRGGKVGLLLSNQQFEFRGLTFMHSNTAIKIDHVFTATFQDVAFINCGTGIDAGAKSSAGSFALIDSSATSVGNVIVTDESGNGYGSIIIENLQTTNVEHTVVKYGGKELLAGGSAHISQWTQGNIYPNNENQGSYQQGNTTATIRSTKLTNSDGSWFTKPRTQYEEYDISSFASVKAAGAIGDGVTDDTAAINAALAANVDRKITYFPAGTYLVTDTIFVPAGSRIVGEVWSAITASGNKFADESNPHVMIRVGNPGDTGIIEWSDMVFTTADILPGLILMEINISGSTQGAVSFHETHFRIGGAAGSTVQTSCNTDAASCKAAFMLLHVKPTASAYFENIWGWTADHDLDGSNGQTISSGRGVLIEATGGTWFVGSAFEHHTLYQYQLLGAENVYFGVVQVETPYWQPGPEAPTPWLVNTKFEDPSFEDCGEDVQCGMAWGVRVIGGGDIYLYGSGFWTFFNKNTQDCAAGDGNCQTNIIDISGDPYGLYLYNTNVKSVKNMVVVNGTAVATRFNNPGSWGGVIAAYNGFV